MPKYKDVEEAVCALLSLRAFYNHPRAPDFTTFMDLGCFVTGGTFESDHVARGHKAEFETLLVKVCQQLPLHKWACWVDLRVTKTTERHALKRHNTRMVEHGQHHLCCKSKNTPVAWSREVDARVEEALSRKGWLLTSRIG